MIKFRSKIWNEQRVNLWLYLRYLKRSYLGLMRGKLSTLLGRVIYQGARRPLIMSAGIDYDMGTGSAIVMADRSNNAKPADPANIFYPSASSIGVLPHWNHMNPPMAHPTRLRIRNHAKLILEPNTVILTGGYLAVWPGQELRLGADTYVAHGVSINTRCGLRIGSNVMIGHETTIMDYDGHPVFSTLDEPSSNADTYGGAAAPISIEDNVWIGFRTTILKGVTIGTGSIIGANSCVTSNIPPNCIAAGNPARIIKENIVWRKY